jgi:hypothetical protein
MTIKDVLEALQATPQHALQPSQDQMLVKCSIAGPLWVMVGEVRYQELRSIRPELVRMLQREL